jgi:5'-nucleotidase
LDGDAATEQASPMLGHTALRRLAALVVVPLLLLAGCGDDDGNDEGAPAATTTTVAAAVDETTTTPAPTTTAAPEPLRILVTNDDGIGSPGIDALVEALRDLPDTEITVVAPAENQSGKGDSTSPVTPESFAAKTLSGYDGWAVPGTPADSVIRALESVLDEPPHLVVSGSNEGQNIGPFTLLSGTVGAAKTAARRGVPALAVSSGVAQPTDFAPAVAAAVAWVQEHRAELLARAPGAPVATIENINAPTCATGTVRDVIEVPVATDFGDRKALDPVACDAPAPPTPPADDVDAFIAGYVPLSVIPV